MLGVVEMEKGQAMMEMEIVVIAERGVAIWFIAVIMKEYVQRDRTQNHTQSRERPARLRPF